MVEREEIVQTTNQNPDNPWFGTPGGATTQDYVFLLSLDEVLEYFGDSGQLANQDHPDNALWGFGDSFNDARIANHVGQLIPEWNGEIEENQPWLWWLRSPGDSNRNAIAIFDEGSIYVSGIGVDVYSYGVLYDVVGVRPALWLNLETGIF
jgi:hypothetical protein